MAMAMDCDASTKQKRVPAVCPPTRKKKKKNAGAPRIYTERRISFHACSRVPRRSLLLSNLSSPPFRVRVCLRNLPRLCSF
jgi:hypothetical protein